MTVKELINRLNKLDKKAEVILSRDAEGNGFNILEELSIGYYHNRTGDFFTEEDVENSGLDSPNYIKAICLWSID